MRPDGDFIELRVYLDQSGQFVVTDEWATTRYLFLSGLSIAQAESAYGEASAIAARNGVDFTESEFRVVVPESGLAEALHRMICATVAASELIRQRTHRTGSRFKDEVENYLLDQDLPYTKRHEVWGKATLHQVAFYLNSRYNRLVEPLTATSRQAARNQGRLLAYEWIDVAAAGHTYVRAAMLDDREGRWEKFWSEPDLFRPIEDYSDKVFRWSAREQLLHSLHGTTR